MLIEQFKVMDDFQKMKAVSSKGVFIGFYEENGNMSDIYKLFNFYVEFYYNINQNEGVIISANLEPEQLPIITKIIASEVNEDP